MFFPLKSQLMFKGRSPLGATQVKDVYSPAFIGLSSNEKGVILGDTVKYNKNGFKGF